MTATEPQVETAVNITVDGKAIAARPGELLIDAAERGGIYIPRFCYHHRMEPVGMCRMCLVEIETPRGKALQPSCMVTVAPDMVVETESPVAKKAQDGILEFLLINHPLDCPVCDKGGECPLQDHTISFGPGESRFVEEKRHYEKPIAISDNVFLDRERCILCDRCTRFAKDVAGDTLIHFQDRGNGTQVNTFPDHPFASYFSGNTVQICPVGALTAKPYRFKARPWDLDVVESTCQDCAVGCRIVVDSSRDEVLRYVGVDSDPVNWSWLCDKGRFGFESVGTAERLTAPLAKGADGTFGEVRWADALGAAAKAIKAGIDRSGPGGVAVIGGSRLTNEAAYAWAKLAKGVIGTDHTDAQLGDGLPADVLATLPRATIDEACADGGTLLVIGSDPKDELPVLFLRIRDAVTRHRTQVIELAPRPTSLTELAAHVIRTTPGAVDETVAAILAGEGDHAAVRDRLASGPFTVLLGRSSLGEGPDATVAAALALADAFPEARFLSALRRSNVHGALDAGLTPGLLPGRVPLAEGTDHFTAAWGKVPAEPGLDTAGILAAAADGRIDTLVLLGADPLADFPDRDLATRGLAGARTIIAVETIANASTAEADIVLPAAGTTEVDGTTTNLEGRVTVVRQKVTPPGTARPDWQIAAELAFRLGADLGFASPEEIWDELASTSPVHHGITGAQLIEESDGLVLGRQAGFAAPSVTEAAAATEAKARAIAAADDASDAADAAVAAAAAELETATAALAEADAAVKAAQAVTKEAKAAAKEATKAAEAAEGDADLAAAATAATAAVDAATAESDTAKEAKAAAKAAVEAATAAHAEAEERAAAADAALAEASAEPEGPTFPPTVDRPTSSYSAPPVDAYSLRLVTVRKLYDQGTLVQHAPSLAGLATGAHAAANPADLARLGVDHGEAVRITSPRGSLTTTVAPDATVPEGTLTLAWAQGDPSPTVLIDATGAVTEVRLESTP